MSHAPDRWKNLAATEAVKRPGDLSPAEEAIRTCPNCGSRLHERKCKLFCPEPACGYYLSCADYY